MPHFRFHIRHAMKPVVISQACADRGPRLFCHIFSRHGIPWQVVKIDDGEAVPGDPRAFGGIALMGGPMSVNDDLPWIRRCCSLIRAAVGAGVPVIGHCLGGQLMSKALGGEVTRNPVKEIGWGRVDVVDHPVAGAGSARNRGHSPHFTGTARPSASRRAPRACLPARCCENQAFALGPHFAMQCHVEMTEELIRSWCQDWWKEVQSLGGARAFGADAGGNNGRHRAQSRRAQRGRRPHLRSLDRGPQRR